MPCARSFSPKSYFCIQRHISCKWYNFFFQTKKHTFLLYVHLKKEAYFLFTYIFIYIVYKLVVFFFYTFPGQAPYTHRVQRHATLALLFAFYSWLAGRHDVIQTVLQLVSISAPTLNTHTHAHIFSLSLFVSSAYNHTSPSQPGTGLSRCVTLPRWRQGKGAGSRVGPTSFKWNNKSSAARLCGACRDGRGNGCGLGQGGSKVSGGFGWRVWGLAQGCRQIREWEVWEGGGWQGKEGHC